MRIVYTSTQRPAPALRLRHSVGWFRFTFPSLTFCTILSHADINSTQRARSPPSPVRRGVTPSAATSPPSTRARARHPSSPVPQSPSLFISHILSPHETRAHTWTVLSCPFSAHTGAPQSAAPVVTHPAPPCRGRATLAPCCCACCVGTLALHSTVPTGSPPRRAPRGPKGLRVPFSRPFPAPLPRRPWIAHPNKCGLARSQRMLITHTSPQRPAPALRPRDSVGRFEFTSPALAFCTTLSRADSSSAQRARSPALSAPRRRPLAATPHPMPLTLCEAHRCVGCPARLPCPHRAPRRGTHGQRRPRPRARPILPQISHTQPVSRTARPMRPWESTRASHEARSRRPALPI